MGLLLIVALALGVLALVRRNAAGTARAVSPPGGAVTALPEGGTYQRIVLDRAAIVECAWREPTRWWPRTVQLTMLRPPPPGRNRGGWPDRTFVIIGSGLGE